jgi:hypothetical protein
MAINVDTVYKTVLLILNKEQRGYMTPDEFNKTAAQVQLEIFETYFDDLNQQLRVPDNDSEYADRQKSLQEKLSVFHSVGNCVYDAPYFDVPVDSAGFYKLGTVIYNDEKEVQYVQPNELLELNLSPLTKPTEYYPVYKYKDFKIYVYPTSIVSNITATYLRKPLDPIWDFTATPPYYQYIYNSGTSVDFELHPTEQVNVITKILLYSGVIIKDPQIIQVAAQQIQAENINSKS